MGAELITFKKTKLFVNESDSHDKHYSTRAVDQRKTKRQKPYELVHMIVIYCFYIVSYVRACARACLCV